MNTPSSSPKVALLFSGQGAQVVGMGRDLAENYPVVRDMYDAADEILGRPISRISFEGPPEELTQTANCQPALYLHGLACLAALRNEWPQFAFSATAGLSLGEFTAHAAAGTFPVEPGLKLVEQRAQFMQEACDSTEGAMAAMIGAEENVVRNLAAETDVDIANLNSPGQIVIAGEASKVALAVSLAKEHGIRRATLLNVAGAYHSRLMQSAYLKLAEVLGSTPLNSPRQTVVCNVDAAPVSEPEEIREALREQVTGSVRWVECMEYLIDHEKCDLFLELGPGGVLAGLLGRIRKGTPVHSISDTETLRAVVAQLQA
jgi:[acyl-carrier-protein] S-malonyltransferase